MRKLATYDDLIALPDNVVGELIDGELLVHPRPGSLASLAKAVLGADLGLAFHRGKAGPGGWVILDEPELHLGPQVLVPDLVGWRRARMPEVPNTTAFTLSPDWVCEVLSPSTSRTDRAKKRPIYAREGVRHLWLVDPDAHTLEVFRLDGGGYRLLATHDEDQLVRAEPFDAIELELGALWARLARRSRSKKGNGRPPEGNRPLSRPSQRPRPLAIRSRRGRGQRGRRRPRASRPSDAPPRGTRWSA